jgi:SAM-dependent methyltransferase/uncharacterized protein YbaR (Trm112 family)
VGLDLFERLACPLHRTPLMHKDSQLLCESGCEYPVLDGIPFLLPAGVDQTDDDMFRESFACAEKLKARRGDAGPATAPEGGIDPRVQEYVAHTNSTLYKSVVGRLKAYPIPDFPMRASSPSAVLLDVGCGWGRWCCAAARAGFIPVGIDPSLPHLLAAQRVAKQLGHEAYFVVADSRYLPFLPGTFDAAFSFSVLQHFSRADVEHTLRSLAPAMKPGATSKLHILNWLGLRSLQVQLRRGFREGDRQFDTRYWSLPDALQIFRSVLGASRSHIEVDGFFVQARYEDRKLLTPANRLILDLSRLLTALSRAVPPLARFADNVFIVSETQAAAESRRNAV